MTWEASERVRCSALLHGDSLQCALPYDHQGARENKGHVYVSGSYVSDRHGHE